MTKRGTIATIDPEHSDTTVQDSDGAFALSEAEGNVLRRRNGTKEQIFDLQRYAHFIRNGRGFMKAYPME